MHAHELIRWAVALVLGLLGWWLILMNFAVVYAWLVRRKHHSWIPLVGGFFALAGMAICPLPEVRHYAFWPLFIDVGYCLLALSIGFLMEIHIRRKKHDA